MLKSIKQLSIIQKRKFFLFVIMVVLFFGFVLFLPVQKANADTDTGLLGHWKFEAGSGTTAIDSSGNGHLGTVSGDAVWVNGVVGDGALQFDGVNDWVTLSNGGALNTNLFTISFWMNGASNFSGTVYRLTRSVSVTSFNSKYEIRVTPTGVTFRTGDGTSSADDDLFSTSLTGNLWWHIACTLDSNNVKACYKNGELISSSANSVNVSLNNASTAFIGTNRNNSGTNLFEGILDDVKIYGRALSASDIQEMYALGVDSVAPSAPRNLTTDSVFASTISFSWELATDNVAVIGYNIYRNGQFVASTANTSYTDSGLSVNTAYNYSVSAYDQAGNVSSKSSSISVTTLANTFSVKQGGGGDYTTIGACVAVSSPGDVCVVYAGTYNETLAPTVNGTYSYPVVVQANGNDVINLDGVNFDQADFVHIKNIKVKNIYRHGITWTFNNYYKAGLFANEDWWVLGPVTISSMLPAYNGISNGWQVNPAVSGYQGFDGRITASFNASLVPSLPYTSGASVESVIKTISAPGTLSAVQTAAVLTIVPSVPSNNGDTVFRPPYMGTDKPFYNISDLHTQHLSSLSPVGTPPSLETVASRYKYLRLEHISGNQRSFRPIDAYGDTGIDGYGPQVSAKNAEDILRLLLNDPLVDKMPALIGVTQHSLDQTYSVMGGVRKSSNGHDPNHPLAAAFAAVMLDIDIAKTYLLSAKDFEEDQYTATGVNNRSLWGADGGESAYWNYVISQNGNRGNKDPYGFIDGGNIFTGYQLILSQSYKGEALVGTLIPEIGSTAWNPVEWPVLTGYAERWTAGGFWTQADPCAPYDSNPSNYKVTYGPDPENPGMCILDTDLEYYNSPTDFVCQSGKECGRFPSYHRTSIDGGQYKSAFVASMWNAYYQADTNRPVITVFTIPSASNSLTVPVSAFIATDNTSVASYLITETSVAPSTSNSGWKSTPITSYVFSTSGNKNLYAWAMDDARNISNSLSAKVNITIANTSSCGDGTCNGSETCSTCSSDCGACSNTVGGGGGSGGGGGGTGVSDGSGNMTNNSSSSTDSNASINSANPSDIDTIKQEDKKIENQTSNQNQEVATSHKYKTLFGLSGEIADSVSNGEAIELTRKAVFVNLSETALKIYKNIVSLTKKTLNQLDKYKIANFINDGTPVTVYLGAGERGGSIASFQSAFNRLPESETDWQDVIKIGNGRWPSQRSTEAENRAKLSFKKIYLREANMNQANDNAAVTVMAYGLRPANRNLNSEKTAILTFKHIFKKNPATAEEWDIVRAIAYSGAKR